MAKPTLLFLLLFTATGKLFSFVQFIGFFGPLIGIFLGFDSINRERVSRTLSKIVSQPIYRDSIINAKFLAGVTIIAIVLVAIVLLISGLGHPAHRSGSGPGRDLASGDLHRHQSSLHLLLVGDFDLVLCGFSEHGDLCTGLAGDMDFLLLFCEPGGGFFGGCRRSDRSKRRKRRSQCGDQARASPKTVSLFSPMTLYSEATNTILDPTRKTTRSIILMGPLERLSLSRFQNPLPLVQSIVIVIPHLISIVAITFSSFGICYLVFMRQEIRTV